MTVSTIASREQYATDGVTTAYPIHFPFFDESDVKAVRVDAAGYTTALVLAADYTVTGGGGSGGTLTTSAALPAGGTLTVYRSIPFTQEDNYVENDPLPAATLEGGFDRAAMRDQQLQDGLARAMTLPVTIDPAVSAILPAPQPSLFLRWNGAGTALELVALADVGAAVAAGIAATRAGTNGTDFVTPDSLASLWRKGADIASAATLAKPADASIGGYHVITGTTQVQHLWTGTLPGESYWFECAAALPVKNGPDLVTRTGADVTFAAGDRFRMMYFGSDIWKMVEVDKGDALAGPQSYAFSANKNGSAQGAIPATTATKVTFQNELFDAGGAYDAPNSKFVAPAPGKYLFCASLYLTSGVVDQQSYFLMFYKNGAEHLSPINYASGASTAFTATVLVDLASGDYLEVYVYCTGAGSKTITGQAQYTFFQGVRIG